MDHSFSVHEIVLCLSPPLIVYDDNPLHIFIYPSHMIGK